MLRDAIRSRPLLLLVGLPAAVAATLAITIFGLSTTGTGLFGFAEDRSPRLEADQAIRANIRLDRPSYHLGDRVRYTLELVWRDDRVRPDIDTLRRAISFYPFDRRAADFVESRARGGFRKLEARFVLQPVVVDTPGGYQLDTVTVFYTRADDGHSEVHALRANPPPVYLGEYYPADIRTIPTRPAKSYIDAAGSLRGSVLGGAGFVLIAAAAFLAWRQGRRRSGDELTAAETLWRNLDALRNSADDLRARLVGCEALFVDALELRFGIDAPAFWSGDADAIAADESLLVEARGVFRSGYRHAEPAAQDVARGEEFVADLLAPLVVEDRLRREQQPAFVGRLRQQPGVVAAIGTLGLIGVVALGLAAVPSAWLAGEIRAYNDAVALLEEEADPQAALDAFLLLADQADKPRVKAASLYNTGTLLGDFRLTRMSRETYESFINAIFLPELTLSRLMHDLDTDAEFELVGLLTDMTRRYVQAEEALRAAVRLDPDDADARRNLELYGKLRKAIAQSLARLAREGEQGSGTEQMLSQTVIDLKLLMESELPDDFAREDEGKDDRDYYIMERF